MRSVVSDWHVDWFERVDFDKIHPSVCQMKVRGVDPDGNEAEAIVTLNRTELIKLQEAARMTLKDMRDETKPYGGW